MHPAPRTRYSTLSVKQPSLVHSLSSSSSLCFPHIDNEHFKVPPRTFGRPRCGCFCQRSKFRVADECGTSSTTAVIPSPLELTCRSYVQVQGSKQAPLTMKLEEVDAEAEERDDRRLLSKSTKAPSIKSTKAPSLRVKSAKAPSVPSGTCPDGSSVCNADGWTCSPPPPQRRLTPSTEVPCSGFRRLAQDLMFDLLPDGHHSRRLEDIDTLLLPCPDSSDALLTCAECCVAETRRLVREENPLLKPWMNPQVNKPPAKVELVQEDPGIWKISNFFSNDTIARLTDAVSRAGDDSGHFGRCAGVSHEHLDDKECFRFSEENSHPQDEDLVGQVMEEIQTLWPSQQEQRGYMYAQRTKPGCGPTEIHRDVNHFDSSTSATTTTVLYLSDGGAGVFFPHINTVIHPKKGMMLTWLNVKPDGNHNYKANHGIQASPEHLEVDRLALTFRVNLSEQERVEAAKASSEEL